MKKALLSLVLFVSAASFVNAQSYAYTEDFSGGAVPTNWVGGATYTLSESSGKLSIVMNDSVGPEQLWGTPANWASINVALSPNVNMVSNKTISIFIDASAVTVPFVLNVQPQDVNGKYADDVKASIAAGFSGTVVLNYAGKFENYYGSAAEKGKIDSTHISQINVSAVGENLTATPWNKQFKGNFILDDFQVGGVVAGLKAAQAITSSKLFPNPSSDLATVELNLKSASDVKVTLTDMMGKEIEVIAEEKTAALNKSFSVANLVEGVYTVNYYINGEPAKAELLMVK